MASTATPGDGWQPDQYHRFRAQRSAPFFDLLGLVEPVPSGRAVDLGCGTGELTVELHRHVQAAATVGVDRSPAMLDQAGAHEGGGVSFRHGDIGLGSDLADLAGADVVLANAALQWVPDHRGVLAAWTRLLADGGQLAVQVPANADHPSHVVSADVAHEAPFLDALGEPPPDPVRSVLRPEEYAELLEELGFERQHVRLQVYGHRLDTSAEVVEWVKGTSLVRFRERLPEDLFRVFLERYRERLLEVIGDRRPYFYAFKRILLWGAR